ncbi:ADP-ribosylation factor-like protein 2 [Cinclus cinclus]|uniref:ADP-ribosylation factor-like protein 2 n=1 Tax=Cinclus cinclus TaxID=127875 RepID=UPI002E0F302E
MAGSGTSSTRRRRRRKRLRAAMAGVAGGSGTPLRTPRDPHSSRLRPCPAPRSSGPPGGAERRRRAPGSGGESGSAWANGRRGAGFLCGAGQWAEGSEASGAERVNGWCRRGACPARAAAMGLLTILKKMREKERELRLLVLGLDNAGKTTLLKRLNGEDVGGTSPTLGFNIKTLEHRG